MHFFKKKVAWVNDADFVWDFFGSLHRPLEPFLGGLWTKKTLKKYVFLRFLQMQGFGFLELLVALLGPSSFFLGLIRTLNSSLKRIQTWCKKAPNEIRNIDPSHRF